MADPAPRVPAASGAEPGDGNHSAAGAGSPARLANWPGFLLLGVAVNVLFLWGMMGSMGDSATAAWTRALSWLPFNLIASVFYLVCYLKLSHLAFRGLAAAMTGANWIAFFAA